MVIGKIRKEALKLSVPTAAEEKRVKKVVAEILEKVNRQAQKDKLNATLVLGGSVGKGTWLPELSDMDFFLVFDYDEFVDKSGQLSDFTENLLRKIFKAQRLHGSRDYFAANYEGFYAEIVPVLRIENLQQAKNITDFSPLHVSWIRNKIAKNKKLALEIRLAKQFFKAAGVYGAESYIRGLSGHTIEILIIYYGSLENLVEHVTEWKEKQVIDVERRFRNSENVFKILNKAKLESPLIVIDPVEQYRNAAAALSKEKFLLAKKACLRFLEKPSIGFFTEKPFSIADLQKRAKGFKLVVLKSAPERGKVDVVGAKLLKKFEGIGKILKEKDFVMQDSGWWWPEKGAAYYWFFFDTKPLPATKEHFGPPAKMKEFAKVFRKKWKTAKEKKGRLVAEIKRKYTKPEELLKEILKKDSGLKLVP